MSSDLGPVKHIFVNQENPDDFLGAFAMTEGGPKSVTPSELELAGFGNVEIQAVNPNADVAELFKSKFSQCGASPKVPSIFGKIGKFFKKGFEKGKQVVQAIGESLGGVVDKVAEVVVEIIEQGGKECFAIIDDSAKGSGQAQVEVLDKGIEIFIESPSIDTAEIISLDQMILPADLSMPMSSDISEAMISSLLISNASGNDKGVSGDYPSVTMAKAMVTPNNDDATIGDDHSYAYDGDFIANAVAYANIQDSESGSSDVIPDAMHDGIDFQVAGQEVSVQENRRASRNRLAEKDVVGNRRDSESSKESSFARRTIDADKISRSKENVKGYTRQTSGSSKTVVQTSSKKENNAPKKGLKLSDPDLVGDPNDQLVGAYANGGQGGAGAAMAAGSILRHDSGAAAAEYVASLEEGGQERVGSTDNQGESHEGDHSEDDKPEKNNQEADSALA